MVVFKRGRIEKGYELGFLGNRIGKEIGVLKVFYGRFFGMRV